MSPYTPHAPDEGIHLINAAVIGLGKMGLPIAAYLAVNGASVTGIDVDETVVETINAGRSTVSGEVDLAEAISCAVDAGTLQASTSFADIHGADVVVVLVPLLAPRGEPEFGVLDSVTDSVAEHVSDGALVIYETTLPVGTTRERFAAVLRARSARVSVAFSPERVFSGRVFADLKTYPKIVGGVDKESTARAVDFYRAVLTAEVWPVASSEEAEMVKLAETTYRDLNIAYANELAKICDGLSLDVLDVIRGANSQPFSHIHQPGIGVGGHCIPHYPHLLLNAGIPSELISLGRAVNDGMPEWAVERLESHLGPLDGRTVVGLGVAYRPGVREHESSPVFGVQAAVEARGGILLATDPLYSADAIRDLGLLEWDGIARPDAFVLITDHDAFRETMVGEFPNVLVLDGRNHWDGAAVEAAGATYLGFGR